MTPVVAVIAPGMMGAAVGKRLVDNGLKVLTSLGAAVRTRWRAPRAGMQAASDEEIAATDLSSRSCRRVMRWGWHSGSLRRSRRATASRSTSTATRSARRRPSASPPCSRRPARRSSMPASSAARRSRATRARASTPRAERAALCHAPAIRARRARARRPAERGLGAEDVLCRHHQGHAGARRGDDAGRDAAPARPMRCSRSSKPASRTCSPG